MSDKIKLTEEQWREKLTPEQYKIAREKGTERAFTGQYYDCKDRGTYHCTCCGAELFSSDEKFDSGSGWPSFTAPVQDSALETKTDTTHGMIRTEVICGKCDAHLGHVFDDGPGPSGKRFCINSISLDLKAKSNK